MLAGTLALASPASGDTTPESAPGRIIFPVANGRARLASAIPFLGGGALLVGLVGGSGRLYIAKVSESGALDPSFGAGGIATVNAELAFEQILLQPDGHILLIGMHSSRGHLTELKWDEPHGSLVVERLDPNGTIDASYGTAGTAQTTIEGGCYCDQIALEQEDGKLVLTGQRRASVEKYGSSVEAYSWELARLTADGTLDPSFGQGGLALVPGEEGVGLSILPSANDTIVAQGQAVVTSEETAGERSTGPENMMTRLTADGAIDRTYAGGTPFELPVYSIGDSYGQTPEPLEALSEPGGRIVIETFPIPANPGRPKGELGAGLLAYDNTGQFDKSFGYSGLLNFEEGRDPSGSELLAGPAGTILAMRRPLSKRPSDNPQAVEGLVEFQRITASGTIDEAFAKPPGRPVTVAFGGGLGEPSPLSPYSYPETRLVLDQNTFLGSGSSAQPIPQTDGSYLLAGNVTLQTPAGRHRPETSRNWFALAKLTPSLSLDSAFGTPAPIPALNIRLPRQSLRDDMAHRRVLVAVEASRAGLVELRLHARGRPLGHKLAAMLSPGTVRIAVPLPGSARHYLRTHRGARVSLGASSRDLFADPAGAVATLTLR